VVHENDLLLGFGRTAVPQAVRSLVSWTGLGPSPVRLDGLAGVGVEWEEM